MKLIGTNPVDLMRMLIFSGCCEPKLNQNLLSGK